MDSEFKVMADLNFHANPDTDSEPSEDELGDAEEIMPESPPSSGPSSPTTTRMSPIPSPTYPSVDPNHQRNVLDIIASWRRERRFPSPVLYRIPANRGRLPVTGEPSFITLPLVVDRLWLEESRTSMIEEKIANVVLEEDISELREEVEDNSTLIYQIQESQRYLSLKSMDRDKEVEAMKIRMKEMEDEIKSLKQQINDKNV